MWNVLFCNPGFHYTRDYYYLSILRRFTIQTKLLQIKKLCLSGAVELRERGREQKAKAKQITQWGQKHWTMAGETNGGKYG